MLVTRYVLVTGRGAAILPSHAPLGGGHAQLPGHRRRAPRPASRGRLQTDGLVETYLVESSSGPSRKYYRLTEAGKKSFGSQKASWKSFSGAVEDILGEAQ